MEGDPIPAIRRASPADMSGAAELVHTVWHEHEAQFVPEVIHPYRTVAFFAERLATMEGVFVAPDEKDFLVGLSAWQGNYLDFLMIRAEFRSAGIGAALLRATEDEIRQASHQSATLLCMVGNEGARRFYERHGWRWLGEVEIQVPLGADRIKQTRWQMEKALEG